MLAALLAGARVRVERDALEYRRYRRTAPLASIRNAPVWSGACGRWVFVLLGQVAGKVWATKIPALTGQAFLTVRVGERLLVCADCVGAGEGETVLVATGGGG